MWDFLTPTQACDLCRIVSPPWGFCEIPSGADLHKALLVSPHTKGCLIKFRSQNKKGPKG